MNHTEIDGSRSQICLRAKSDGTSLLDHTRDVFFEAYRILKSTNLTQYAERAKKHEQFGLSSEQFIDVIYLSVMVASVMHDVGKAHPAFQALLSGKSRKTEVIHSLVSAFCIDEDSLLEILFNDVKLEKIPGKLVLKIIRSSIAFHHWRRSIQETVLIEDPEVLLHQVDEALDNLLNSKTPDLILKTVRTEGSTGSQDRVLSAAMNYLEKFLRSYTCRDVKERILSRLRCDIRFGAEFKDFFLFPYSAYFAPDRLLCEGIELLEIVLGMLLRADHLASSHKAENMQSENSELPDNQAVLISFSQPNLSVNVCWQDVLLDYLEKFEGEENLIKTSEVVVLKAPTGVGKTYFAFKWFEKVSGQDAIFTLPFCAAVEQTFKNFEDCVSDKCKTIATYFHGKLKLQIFDEFATTESDTLSFDNPEVLTLKRNLTKELDYRVIVTTGHQIFPSALGYPGYPKILVRCVGSCIIIDEVQVYNVYALAVLASFVVRAIQLGSKVLFISATIPEFFIEAVERILKNKMRLNAYEPNTISIDVYKREIRINDKIKQVEAMDQLPSTDRLKMLTSTSRHCLHIIEASESKTLADELQKILPKYEAAKNNGNKSLGFYKVCIVVNTVRAAQKLYIILNRSNDEFRKNILNGLGLKGRSPRVLIIHSRFTDADRKNKIQEITQLLNNAKDIGNYDGLIVISTQVLEVALDISFDLIISAMAPLDCLIQRMGRLNRGAEYTSSRPFIIIKPAHQKPTNANNGSEEDFHSIFGTTVYDQCLIDQTISILNSPDINDKELSERKKSDLLCEYYRKLKDTEFYNKFSDMLNLLESGFVTETKDDAEMLFGGSESIFVLPKKNDQQNHEGSPRGMEDFNLMKNFLVSVPAYFKKDLDPWAWVNDSYARDKFKIPKFIVRQLYAGGYYDPELGWSPTPHSALTKGKKSTAKRKTSIRGNQSNSSDQFDLDYLFI